MIFHHDIVGIEVLSVASMDIDAHRHGRQKDTASVTALCRSVAWLSLTLLSIDYTKCTDYTILSMSYVSEYGIHSHCMIAMYKWNSSIFQICSHRICKI